MSFSETRNGRHLFRLHSFEVIGEDAALELHRELVGRHGPGRLIITVRLPTSDFTTQVLLVDEQGATRIIPRKRNPLLKAQRQNPRAIAATVAATAPEGLDYKVQHYRAKNQPERTGIDSLTLRIFAPKSDLPVAQQWATKLQEQLGIPVVLDFRRIGQGSKTLLRKLADPDYIVRDAGALRKILKGFRESQRFKNDLGESLIRLQQRQLPDFTDKLLLTIDQSDCADPGDGLGIERLNNGHTVLRIAFVDTSWRVPFGSPAEREARRRGFSVYGHHHDFQMLGKEITREVCFIAKESRPAWYLQAEFDQRWQLVDQKVDWGSFRCNDNLSHQQASTALRDRSQPYGKELRLIARAVAALTAQRESDLAFTPVPGPFASERLLAQAMIVGKHALAQFCVENSIPAIYRRYEMPSPQARQSLLRRMHAHGLAAENDDFIDQLRFTKLVGQLYAVRQFGLFDEAIRLYQGRANYSLEAGPHLGVGVDCYMETKAERNYAALLLYENLARFKLGQPLLAETQLQPALRRLNRQLRVVDDLYYRIHSFERIQEGLTRRGHEFLGTTLAIRNDALLISVPGFDTPGLLPLDSFREGNEPIRGQLDDSVRARLEGYDVMRERFVFKFMNSL